MQLVPSNNQQMAEIYFENDMLIKMLLDEVPEFKDSIIQESVFSAYLIYGDFGIFLRDKILGDPDNIEFLERAFGLLNKLIDVGDSKVIQMLRVTTFEILTDYSETIATTKLYLKGKALSLFLEVINFIKNGI